MKTPDEILAIWEKPDGPEDVEDKIHRITTYSDLKYRMDICEVIGITYEDLVKWWTVSQMLEAHGVTERIERTFHCEGLKV